MDNKIELKDSKIVTTPLIGALTDVYSEKSPEILLSEQQTLKVSRAVSFFALMYEKIRNAVEFREEHLIRRAAIERILKRRLVFNNEGKNIAENIIRELLWARYLPNNTVPEEKISIIQNIIDKYLYLRRELVPGRPKKEGDRLDQFILDILSCEIEESLSPDIKREAYTNFVYHSLLTQVQISDPKLNEEKNIFIYIATELGFAKSDIPLVRYHLIRILLPELIGSGIPFATKALPDFISVYDHIENVFKNPVVEKLRRFVKRNIPPYLVLRDILEAYPGEAKSILTSEEQLKYKVDEICRKRYQESRAKLTRAGVRSIIYIFLTKMIFAILLEYPFDLFLQKKVDLIPLSINIVFPPFLMFLVVLITSVPGSDNTRRIYQRIKTLISHATMSVKSVIRVKSRIRRPLLTLGFSFIYLLAFILSFGSIIFILSNIGFNIVSQAIFIFFVSLVMFFGYRIRQTAKEYLLIDKEAILTPLVDFFMLPILSLGKWLSSEIAKINIFIFFFDFIIEAPFKAIFELIEEWIIFVRHKKEEFT